MLPFRVLTIACLLLCLAALTVCQTCPDGEYPLASEPGCGKCPPECTKCDNLEQCTECVPPRTPENQCQCPGQPTPDSCDCPANCYDCPDTLDTCTECDSGYGLNDSGACVECTAENCADCDPDADLDVCTQCVDGFFQEDTCKPCKSTCATCENADECQTCPNGARLVGNQCVRCPPGCDSCTETECEMCRIGFFEDTDGSCQPCAPGCSYCTDSTTADCTRCDEGRYLTFANACAWSCPDGEYEFTTNGGLRKCDTCPTGCATCFGPDTESCFTCEVNMMTIPPTTYYLDGNTCATTCSTERTTFPDDTSRVCVPCPHACASCSSQDECLTCDSGFLLSVADKECVVNCGPEQYETGTTCEECSGPCKACTSDTACLSCASDTDFYDPEGKSCGTDCPSRTYKNTETMTCSPCSPRCKDTTCSGPGRDCMPIATE